MFVKNFRMFHTRWWSSIQKLKVVAHFTLAVKDFKEGLSHPLMHDSRRRNFNCVSLVNVLNTNKTMLPSAQHLVFSGTFCGIQPWFNCDWWSPYHEEEYMDIRRCKTIFTTRSFMSTWLLYKQGQWVDIDKLIKITKGANTQQCY